MGITQSISTIPEAGRRGTQSRDDFVVAQEAFQDHLVDNTVDELNTFATQANELKSDVNNYKNDAQSAASSAQDAKGDAELAAIQAQGSANFKGDWNSNTSYSVGQSVYYNNNFYVCKVENSDSSFDDSKWVVNIPSGAIGNINSPLLDMPLQNSLTMNKGTGSVTFTRSTTATYVDRYGVLQYAAIDEPRFEKDGLLIEGASTNILTYSNDFTNGTWTNNSAVTANNAVSPDGTTTADTIDFSSIATVFQEVPINQDTEYTLSLFVKQVASDDAKLQGFASGGTIDKDGYVEYNFSTDTLTATGGYPLTNIKREILSNGWVRISGTQTVTDDTVMRLSINTVSGNGGIKVWGAQLEEIKLASSYIPTTDTAVTKTKDNCQLDYVGNVPQRNVAYTQMCDYKLLRTTISDNASVWSVIDTSTGSSVFVAGVNNYNIAVNYSESYDVFGTSTPNTNTNIAVSVDGTNQVVYKDGLSISNTTQTFSGIVENGTVMRIGDTGTNSPLWGHIKNMKIYDQALTATEVYLLGGK